MSGYIPKVANMTISQMIDRGEYLSASIFRLSQSDNLWQRVEVSVYLRATLLIQFMNKHLDTKIPNSRVTKHLQ